ncbi:MAG: DNA methyltransferase [bacterium]
MKTLFDFEENELLTIKAASNWASEYLKKNVTESNISYLIQYGKVRKIQNNGVTLIKKEELKKYYDSFHGRREIDWKNQLGQDLNWYLSFDYLREADTTKHVHRLHPYKGKFIPQLVEYFIDNHTDEFKKEVYFKPGDIILDPFCGSGTTLVQANELGIHAVGIDVSEFNTVISNAKIKRYDFFDLDERIKKISSALKQFVRDSHAIEFEEKLLQKLYVFNSKHFPSPEIKFKFKKNEIDEKGYGKEKEREFLPIYEGLIKKFTVNLNQQENGSFLDKWYFPSVREEIDFVFKQIQQIENTRTKTILAIILSRTIRSCRATTHSDLATLKEPVLTTYYCTKHKKICKPLFTITRWWETYCRDTMKRLTTFDKLRTATYQRCLTGDSRTMDIFLELAQKEPKFAKLVKREKIKGIFSSPPYVGLIDYHEQHAYAYDLFGFDRKDELEIGPLSNGQGREARKFYAQGISEVLNNCKKYLVDDYDIFLVANDKFNLYPVISEKAGMKIVNRFKRPVLNRTERDKGAYSEIIFHLKGKS